MKHATPLLALAALAAAQSPSFTNSAFSLEEGEPFTITFSGCAGGCTIVLQNGDADDLQDLRTLTSSTTGNSFTFTPDNLPTDMYNFKIINNNSGEENYSVQFNFEGSGPASSSATSAATSTTQTPSSTTESPTSTTEESTTTTEASSTTTESSTTEESSTTTEESSTATSESATTATSASPTTSDEASTTSSEPTESATDIPNPDNGAGSLSALGAPLTLIFAAVAGLFIAN